jgi:hypothetical protein
MPIYSTISSRTAFVAASDRHKKADITVGFFVGHCFGASAGFGTGTATVVTGQVHIFQPSSHSGNAKEKRFSLPLYLG